MIGAMEVANSSEPIGRARICQSKPSRGMPIPLREAYSDIKRQAPACQHSGSGAVVGSREHPLLFAVFDFRMRVPSQFLGRPGIRSKRGRLL
jgi:hypothetical protein